MEFHPPLREAVLLKRYKRFLADVRLDGVETTVHCPNTGRMTGCAAAGSRVWLSESASPRRKYRYTWELVETENGALAGVNTARSNALVEEAINQGILTELQGYRAIRREVPYPGGRIDLLLQNGTDHCYVEVKNVTLLQDEASGAGLFPDAVSTRAARQLKELSALRRQGQRAVVCYCVQHSAIKSVQAAAAIDPDYAAALHQAASQDVEILAYGADLSPAAVVLARRLSVSL